MTSLSTSIQNKMRGFSLIEIIVTIALFGLMVALGVFMSMEAYRGATRRSERDVIVSLLERARSRAMANIEESSWSVCYDAGNYLIAKGSTCDDAHALERVDANDAVAADSTLTDFPVEFAQLSGNVATDKTITVRQAGKTETITINHEGRINW